MPIDLRQLQCLEAIGVYPISERAHIVLQCASLQESAVARSAEVGPILNDSLPVGYDYLRHALDLHPFIKVVCLRSCGESGR